MSIGFFHDPAFEAQGPPKGTRTAPLPIGRVSWDLVFLRLVRSGAAFYSFRPL